MGQWWPTSTNAGTARTSCLPLVHTPSRRHRDACDGEMQHAHSAVLDRSVPGLGYGDVNIIFLHTRARPDATRALGHLIVMASQRPLARGCATCVINLL